MNKQANPLTQPQHDSRYGVTPGYMPGFGNDFETEALPGAIPVGRNSPQRVNYGLYAEQLSGSPFTAPHATLERSWMYRIRPSVKHTSRFTKVEMPYWKTAPNVVKDIISLGQYRWDPTPFPEGETLNFLTGMRTVTTAGDVYTQVGMASHVYLANEDMVDDYFYTADSELLVVPQHGRLKIATEFGIIDLEPLEICLLPRGMVFKVSLPDGEARGFVCENYGAKFTLPNRGPIGANCLANPRDFKTPVAAYEDKEAPCRVWIKWCGEFHVCEIDHSPLDVVAWHGNYAPYKYDLRTYSVIGSISFDHPDPSIFTVLTAPT
ncbi:MAG: homogentisate 1,2-dioxygenase, partial [Pseudomonadota bacterium]